jgi:hypothetical protein
MFEWLVKSPGCGQGLSYHHCSMSCSIAFFPRSGAQSQRWCPKVLRVIPFVVVVGLFVRTSCLVSSRNISFVLTGMASWWHSLAPHCGSPAHLRVGMQVGGHSCLRPATPLNLTYSSWSWQTTDEGPANWVCQVGPECRSFSKVGSACIRIHLRYVLGKTCLPLQSKSKTRFKDAASPI